MSDFLMRNKLAVGLGLALLAATAFVLYRRRQASEAEAAAAGYPVSPYAANLPRGLASGSGIALAQRDGGVPAGGAEVPAGGGSDPVQAGAETFSVSASSEAPNTTTDPILDALISQGVPVTTETQTIQSNIPGHEGETYTVAAGTPEFSPGNFNPNSPAGVLEMNKALASAGMQGTQAGGSAIAPPPDPYLTDPVPTANVVQGGKYVAV